MLVAGSSGSPGLKASLPSSTKRSTNLVADRAVDQQARAGVADLAHVGEDAAIGGGDRAIEIRHVGHEHLRRLAAALERDALHVRLAGVLQDQLADLGRAGEA